MGLGVKVGVAVTVAEGEGVTVGVADGLAVTVGVWVEVGGLGVLVRVGVSDT